MSRIRLNQEYRNKIGTRMRVWAEAEDTQEKRKYDDLKADQIEINDNAWTLAKQIVRRHYTEDDVAKAYYLQNKFENVDTIQPDSCFHFHYTGMVEARDYDNNAKMEEQQIEKHFDFRLNGSTDVENNSSHTSDSEYGYALLRDELKAQEGCNPDILIEQDGKDQNPHLTKFKDANDKGQFIMAHYKWIKSVLAQMKFVKDVVKSYKYLDEAIEFANESGLAITEAEIIRTNSTGLTFYNPKLASEHLKSMKNKNVSREDKILARREYEQNQAIN